MSEISTLSPLDAAVEQAFTMVPDTVLCAYIDLNSGLIMSIKNLQRIPSEVGDVVGAMVADTFQGENVRLLERIVRQNDQLQNDERLFQEIITTSPRQINIRLRGKLYPDYVLSFMCRATVNLGLALTKARQALPVVEAAM